MPIYTTKLHKSPSVSSGVPLGGIGAGKMEIWPDGTLASWTIFNNWQDPADGRIGNCFILRTQLENQPAKLWMLTTAPTNNLDGVDEIVFDGLFPTAELEYKITDCPVNLKLRAWSSFIPQDTKNSALPCAFFDFTATAKDPAQNVRVDVLSCFKNYCGGWNIGRFNTSSKNRISFHTAAPGAVYDQAHGTMTLEALPENGNSVQVMTQWDMKTVAFWLARDNMDLGFADEFKNSGTLPHTPQGDVVSGERFDYCGAISQSAELSAQSPQSDMRFCLSWHMPNHHEGHQYANWFENADGVADYAAQNAAMLESKTLGFINDMQTLPVPQWLPDAVLNNLYVIVASSWYTKKGDYTLYEAPGICPLMGTIDVNYYSSVFTSQVFPTLEQSHIKLFANAQRTSGYIPHDLGRSRIDCPSDGTTAPPLWKDLNPKFILMCLYSYTHTKDAKFLSSVYPNCKKAFEWMLTTDKNNDGLPENEGQDQTFDDWKFFGTNAYTASIYIAAYEAMAKIAELNADTGTQEKCKALYRKAKDSFNSQLWNGEYFNLWVDGENKNSNCASHQLNGQWYTRMLGLESITDDEKIKSSLRSIFRLNTKPTQFGAANSVTPEGELDRSSSQSGSIWPGECYALAAIMIYEGMVEEGLEVAMRTWHLACTAPTGPWNQADNIDAETGKYIFGDSYMRNMDCWTVLKALATTNDQIKAFVEKYSKPAK